MSRRTRPTENVWNYPRPPLLEPTPARLRVVWQRGRGTADGQGEVETVAHTTRGWRVCETSHPPTYYFPAEDLCPPFVLKPSSARQTYCEWKGKALYHDLYRQAAAAPGGGGGGDDGKSSDATERGQTATRLPSASSSSPSSSSSAQQSLLPLVKGRIWSYPSPTAQFQPIKDYLCFYCTPGQGNNVAGPDGATWKCFVDDDEATPQEGDFYGSWVTPEITGGTKGFKGGKGTWGW